MTYLNMQKLRPLRTLTAYLCLILMGEMITRPVVMAMEHKSDGQDEWLLEGENSRTLPMRPIQHIHQVQDENEDEEVVNHSGRDAILDYFLVSSFSVSFSQSAD